MSWKQCKHTLAKHKNKQTRPLRQKKGIWKIQSEIKHNSVRRGNSLKLVHLKQKGELKMKRIEQAEKEDCKAEKKWDGEKHA